MLLFWLLLSLVIFLVGTGYVGCVVHLLAEEDSEKLSLTDKLLNAVLAEAQVVCVCQPMLALGDFHADPGVIPCLPKDISSGRFC